MNKLYLAAVLLAATFFFSAKHASAEYVRSDPINNVDPTGQFANCGEFQKAGGGACSDITTTNSSGATTVTGLRIQGLPSKSLLDQHFVSNDALPIHIPINSIDFSNVSFSQLNISAGFLGANSTRSVNLPRNQISSDNTKILTDRMTRTLGSFRADLNGTATRGPNRANVTFSKTGSLQTQTRQGALSFQGTISNGFDVYDFDIQPGRPVRNLLTRIGSPGPGTKFDIFLDGSIRVRIP